MVVETATGRMIVRRTLKNNPLIPSSSARTAGGSGRLSVLTRRTRNTAPGMQFSSGTRRRGPRSEPIPGTFPREGSRHAFSPDGNRVAAVIETGRQPEPEGVKLWEVDSGREVASFPTAGPIDTAELSFSPDGKTLAAVAAYPRATSFTSGTPGRRDRDFPFLSGRRA